MLPLLDFILVCVLRAFLEYIYFKIKEVINSNIIINTMTAREITIAIA